MFGDSFFTPRGSSSDLPSYGDADLFQSKNFAFPESFNSQENDPNAHNTPKPTQSSQRTQTAAIDSLVSVSVAMLHSAVRTQRRVGGALHVHSKEVGFVCICGWVLEVDLRPSFLRLKVADGSGCIDTECSRSGALQAEDLPAHTEAEAHTPTETPKTENIKVGDVVTVYGSLCSDESGEVFIDAIKFNKLVDLREYLELHPMRIIAGFASNASSTDPQGKPESKVEQTNAADSLPARFCHVTNSVQRLALKCLLRHANGCPPLQLTKEMQAEDQALSSDNVKAALGDLEELGEVILLEQLVALADI